MSEARVREAMEESKTLTVWRMPVKMNSMVIPGMTIYT